uniref:Uncharacterized protein n=1 Tax=Phlebotomus papatasi TaxID=29031 RepID=A0A1B0D7N1_PHLPP
MENTGIGTPAKTLFDLPVEDIMVTHVAKYLDIGDLFALRMCSEYCKVLADQMLGGIEFANLDFSRWKRLKPDASVQNMLSLISTNSRCLRKLIICRIEGLAEDVFFNFLDNNANLREIEISYCTIEPITPIAKLPTFVNCKNIIKLTINRSKGFVNFLDILCKHNNHLLEIDFESMNHTDDKILKTFLEKQPHMENITFAVCSMTYAREILQTIAETCQDLKYLIFENDWDVGDDIIKTIVKNCPKLIKCNLDQCQRAAYYDEYDEYHYEGSYYDSDDLDPCYEVN